MYHRNFSIFLKHNSDRAHAAMIYNGRGFSRGKGSSHYSGTFIILVVIDPKATNHTKYTTYGEHYWWIVIQSKEKSCLHRAWLEAVNCHKNTVSWCIHCELYTHRTINKQTALLRNHSLTVDGVAFLCSLLYALYEFRPTTALSLFWLGSW